MTTGVISVVSMKTASRPASSSQATSWPQHDVDQRGPRDARDVHDHEQQLPADIGVKGMKVDPAQLVNTDATSERIVGMAAWTTEKNLFWKSICSTAKTKKIRPQLARKRK
jgi:hypothetical protein